MDTVIFVLAKRIEKRKYELVSSREAWNILEGLTTFFKEFSNVSEKLYETCIRTYERISDKNITLSFVKSDVMKGITIIGDNISCTAIEDDSIIPLNDLRQKRVIYLNSSIQYKQSYGEVDDDIECTTPFYLEPSDLSSGSLHLGFIERNHNTAQENISGIYAQTFAPFGGIRGASFHENYFDLITRYLRKTVPKETRDDYMWIDLSQWKGGEDIDLYTPSAPSSKPTDSIGVVGKKAVLLPKWSSGGRTDRLFRLCLEADRLLSM